MVSLCHNCLDKKAAPQSTRPTLLCKKQDLTPLPGFWETPVVLEYLTRWVRLRLRAALWRQWKTPRRCRAALNALGGGRGWRVTQPLAIVAPGISPGPKLCPWGSRMRTSGRLVFRH